MTEMTQPLFSTLSGTVSNLTISGMSFTDRYFSAPEPLPENSLTNKTALRLLNAYAKAKDGLLSWKQAADWPDFS